MSIAPATRLDDPYVGPVAFGPDDPLYGRDRERDELLDLLIAERIVLLYSPSGAGKSSLIEAALVPALREAGFEVLPTVRVTHTLPPGSGMPAPANRYVMSVLLSLEEGVPAELQRPVEALAGLTLKEYLASFADRDGRPGNEVLIFDQFEEVLTADPTDEAAKHVFFRQLGDVLRDRGHWALLSMREDFLAALDPYLRYLPTRLRTTYRLDLLSVTEALEAIRRPAERAGVEFAEDAAQQLVDDLRIVRVQRADGVREVLGSYVEPVQLQVACHMLWSMLPPDASAISRADVEALGRVDQALGEYYAERVAVAAERTGIPERVIRDWFDERLITPQGLRSQVLQGPDTAPEAASALLADLMDAHLLRAETRRQATWYELAHDRLIEPVRRDNAAWRESHLSALERAALLWEQEGKPDRLLLVGAELAGAEQSAVERQDAFDSREREFLDASRRADAQARKDVETAHALTRSARRLRITAIGMSVLAVASLVLLGNSLIAWQRTAQQETNTRLLLGAQENMTADEMLATALTAEVARRMGDGDRDIARRLLYQVAQSPVELAFVGQAGRATTAAISDDGTTLVTAAAGDIQLWDHATGEARDRLDLEDGETATTVDVGGDGRTVVVGLDDGTLILWRVGEEPVRWSEGTGFVWSVDLSPDGTRIVSVGASDMVQVWSVDTTLQHTLTTDDSPEAYAALFSPDGSVVATSSELPEVVLWDAETGTETDRIALPDEYGAWSMWFDADGTRLATWTGYAVNVWDLATGETVFPELDVTANAYVNMNQDLTQALLVDYTEWLTVYDLSTQSYTAWSQVPGTELCCAGFDVDPDRAFVLASDATPPTIWRLDPYDAKFTVTSAVVVDDVVYTAWSDGTLRTSGDDEQLTSSAPVEGLDGATITHLASDDDGSWLVGVTDAAEVVVWDASRRSHAYGPESGRAFTAAALLPDGDHMVLGESNGTVGVWDTSTGTLERELISGAGRSVSAIDVSPDGSEVVVTYARPDDDTPGMPTTDTGADTEADTAEIVAVSGGEESIVLSLPSDVARGAGTAAGFSPDGRRVMIGTSAGTVVSFDSTSGKRLDTVRVHRSEVRDVDPGAGGLTLTTGGADTRDQVVLLDEDGALHRTVPSRDDLATAAISADAESIILVTTAGAVLWLPIDDDKLVALVSGKVAHDLTPEDCLYAGVSDC